MKIYKKDNNPYKGKFESISFDNNDINSVNSRFALEYDHHKTDNLILNFQILYSKCILDHALDKFGLDKNVSGDEFNFFSQTDFNFTFSIFEIHSKFDFDDLFSFINSFTCNTLSILVDYLHDDEREFLLKIPSGVNNLLLSGNFYSSRISFRSKVLDSLTYDFTFEPGLKQTNENLDSLLCRKLQILK